MQVDWITRSEILEHVWEHHSDTGSNLVDVYINRVRNKVDQNGFTKPFTRYVVWVTG
jgi:DNA-binding response OmpR family regulator